MTPLIVFCFLLISATFGVPVVEKELGKTLIYLENDNGDVELVDLTSQSVELDATEDDVVFLLYTLDNENDPFIVSPNNESVLSDSDSPFNTERRNLFIIHGWHNNRNSNVNVYIKNATFTSGYDYNVFVTDWGEIAEKNYITARDNVEDVGKIVGDFISYIQTTFDINGTDFLLVGHSLGAHVAGVAAQNVPKRIGHLVGLDPAGPLFDTDDLYGVIDATDGNFVEIIHTNGLLLGHEGRLGDADYYPNGGLVQPGCEWDLTGSCSHSRSYYYYAESITDSNFLARECDDWDDYRDDKCDNQTVTYMGSLNTDDTARNSSYLQVNSHSPYATGNPNYVS